MPDLPPMPFPARDYYLTSTWDLPAWLKIVAVEYEALVQGYPFDRALEPLARRGTMRLLDVGCGTGIFPSFLDRVLPAEFMFDCDLLDISPISLAAARRSLEGLGRFRVARMIETLIEEIPGRLARPEGGYQVIWSIHSFTTVEVKRMSMVLSHLYSLLTPGGVFFIFQLASGSDYQKLHRRYLTDHPRGAPARPYMQAEETLSLLDELGLPAEVVPFSLDHRVDARQPELLEKYLRKVILDDAVDVLQFFAPELERRLSPAEPCYVFHQQVNLMVIRKTAYPAGASPDGAS